MKNNDWKDRLNVVYSTNPDYKYETEHEEEPDTLEKIRQKLRVNTRRKDRYNNKRFCRNGKRPQRSCKNT